MTGKTHQVIGLTTGLATYLFSTEPSYSPATLGAVLVASHLLALLPDIDQPAATIYRQLPFGRAVGVVTSSFLEHRNLSHSLLGTALVGLGFHWLLHKMPGYWGITTHIVLIAGMAAYLSHLVADMVTVEGIPLFFPIQTMYGIPPRPFEGIRILTGHWFENLVVFPLVNLALLMLIYRNWPVIHQIIFH